MGADAEKVASVIVDAGLKVHRALGPGLLESIYEQCLAYELRSRGVVCARQVELPVVYEGMKLDAGFRLDIVAEGVLLIEVKAVESLLPVHQAQILTYMKLSGIPIGFLMNFNVPLFKQGLTRFKL